MASIVQRGGSYSVVYYTKENGIRKQKWESFRTEKEALHRKYMVEQYQQVKKELAHRPQTVGQLIQEYVWLYGRAKWSLSMYESSRGLIRNYINPYFGSVRLGATLFGSCLIVRRASKCPQTRMNTGFFIELPVAEYLKISPNIGSFCTQIEPAIRQILDRFLAVTPNTGDSLELSCL